MQCFKLFWYSTRFLSTELLNFLVDSVLVFFYTSVVLCVVSFRFISFWVCLGFCFGFAWCSWFHTEIIWNGIYFKNVVGVLTLNLSQQKNNKHFRKALSHYGSWYVFLCIEYKQIRNHAGINPKNVNNLRCKNAKALSRGTTPKEILVLKKLV